MYKQDKYNVLHNLWMLIFFLFVFFLKTKEKYRGYFGLSLDTFLESQYFVTRVKLGVKETCCVLSSL